MRWPPYSPNLNIIENVWTYTLQKLQENPPGSLKELHQRVFHFWGQISAEFLQNLYHSLPCRVQAVSRNRGYPTLYWCCFMHMIMILFKIWHELHHIDFYRFNNENILEKYGCLFYFDDTSWKLSDICMFCITIWCNVNAK